MNHSNSVNRVNNYKILTNLTKILTKEQISLDTKIGAT